MDLLFHNVMAVHHSIVDVAFTSEASHIHSSLKHQDLTSGCIANCVQGMLINEKDFEISFAHTMGTMEKLQGKSTHCRILLECEFERSRS